MNYNMEVVNCDICEGQNIILGVQGIMTTVTRLDFSGQWEAMIDVLECLEYGGNWEVGREP